MSQNTSQKLLSTKTIDHAERAKKIITIEQQIRALLKKQAIERGADK